MSQPAEFSFNDARRIAKTVKRVEGMRIEPLIVNRHHPSGSVSGHTMLAVARTVGTYPDVKAWSNATLVQAYGQKNVWEFRCASTPYDFAENGSVQFYNPGAVQFSGDVVYALNESGPYYVRQHKIVTLTRSGDRWTFDLRNEVLRGTLKTKLDGATNPAEMEINAGELAGLGRIWVYNPLGKAGFNLAIDTIVHVAPVVQHNSFAHIRYEVISASKCPVKNPTTGGGTGS